MGNGTVLFPFRGAVRSRTNRGWAIIFLSGAPCGVSVRHHSGLRRSNGRLLRRVWPSQFSLGAQTNLTTGIRYTDETHFLRGSEQFQSADGAVVPIGATFPRASATFKAPTYRLALDHHFTEDFLLYVSWNTGFKSGGFNTQSYTDGPYEPEKLFAYEVGAKTEFLDHKIRINIAGFHDKYKDIQVQHVEGASTAIINGASATLYGADLDFEARLFSQFTISGSAEVLHAVYDSFPNAPTSNPDLAITEPTFGGDAAGHHLGYAAPEQFTIAGDYSFPLPSGELDLNVTVNHSASFLTEPDNVIRQPDYTKVNASLRWKAANDRYDVLLWGRNLTNAKQFSPTPTLSAPGFMWRPTSRRGPMESRLDTTINDLLLALLVSIAALKLRIDYDA